MEFVNTYAFEAIKAFLLRVLSCCCLVSYLCLWAAPASAQLLTNNSVSFTVLAGTTVTIEGSVKNSGTATIANSGIIDVKGDWTHDASNNCFGTTQGTIILSGGTQNIGGVNETVFNNLTLSGTGTKTLLRDITAGGNVVAPSGVLSLNAQILDLNSHQLTITNPSPLAITRTSGFIAGETSFASGYGIIKWLAGGSPAGTSYTFPFGNATTVDYLPVEVNITAAGTGANGFIEASTYPTITSASPNNRPLPDGVAHLAGAFTSENASFTIDRYWIINAGDYSVKPKANLNFTYRDSEFDNSSGSTNSITESSLLAQQWGTVTWLPQQFGTLNPVTNSISISGHTDFDAIWTLAGISNPLPVELISFSANASNNKAVICKWITATEINNDFFTVERSRDLVNFEMVGIVNGAGNSNSVLTYEFADDQPYPGVSYYRLKQTDYDGENYWCQPVAVRLERGSGEPLVFPVPAGETVYIDAGEELEGTETFNLFDVTGRLVLSTASSWLLNGTDRLITLPLIGLSDGIYHFEISSHSNIQIRGRLVCGK